MSVTRVTLTPIRTDDGGVIPPGSVMVLTDNAWAIVGRNRYADPVPVSYRDGHGTIRRTYVAAGSVSHSTRAHRGHRRCDRCDSAGSYPHHDTPRSVVLSERYATDELRRLMVGAGNRYDWHMHTVYGDALSRAQWRARSRATP